MATNIKNTYSSIKKINWGEVVAILAVILSVGGWCLTRIDRQFDRIETTLDRIERDNRDFHGRLASLEGKFEERGKKEN